jgi:eukaryotic-like serine/threonine-protein kinase
MPIATGTRLGVYQVVSAIGAGGMGEVYQAQDTKLGRLVAIKVLPDVVAVDPERVARFEREAKVLASLNHPNIAGLFGMEQEDGRAFLIMELVEGDTLEERIAAAHAAGGFNPSDLLSIATQIAEGVESAHEKGIVHRDLKPANIKISREGRVKVLDFGLARAMAGEPAATGAGGLTHSPTLSMMATQAGMILGTAAYMSPEQAKGLQADHRSDVFSFGVVIYEMVTGRQPFRGETAPDVLASVLARDPDLAAIPSSLHPRLRDLIARCLEKNPRRRWQAIGDVRAELEMIATTPAAPALPAPTVVAAVAPLWKRAIPVVATAVVVLVATAAAMLSLRPVSTSPVARFSYALPAGQFLPIAGRPLLAISPDASQIVWWTSVDAGGC